MPPVQCRCPVNFGLSRGENCAGWAPKEAAELCQWAQTLFYARACPLKKSGAVQEIRCGSPPPVFRRRFKGLNASASTPAMRVELISQDRAQSRMHVDAGFEQGDVRAGSEQTILYEIIGSVTIAAEQNREDSELWDRCEHALVSRRLCSHGRRLKRL